MVGSDRLASLHDIKQYGSCKMSDKFFKVNKAPETYSNEQCHSVIRREPWRRSSFLVGSIKIIGRLSWGAPEPTWSNEVIYYNLSRTSLINTLTNIVVHHTNNSNSVSDNEKKQKTKGYAALGYHFFINADGSVYEGRPLEIMGSHAGRGKQAGALNDPDWGSVGIVLHHDDDWFKSNTAAKKQLNALENLILGLNRKYSIGQLLMHREVNRGGPATVCPGSYLAPLVINLRNKLGMKGKK